MYCTKCGRKNPETNKFCNGCGTKFLTGPGPEDRPVLNSTPPPPPPPLSPSAARNTSTPLPPVFADTTPPIIEGTVDNDGVYSEQPGSAVDLPRETGSEVRLVPALPVTEARHATVLNEVEELSNVEMEDLGLVPEEATVLLDAMFPSPEPTAEDIAIVDEADGNNVDVERGFESQAPPEAGRSDVARDVEPAPSTPVETWQAPGVRDGTLPANVTDGKSSIPISETVPLWDDRADEPVVAPTDLPAALKAAEAELDGLLPNDGDQSVSEQTDVLPPATPKVLLADDTLTEPDEVESQTSLPEVDLPAAEQEAVATIAPTPAAVGACPPEQGIKETSNPSERPALFVVAETASRTSFNAARGIVAIVFLVAVAVVVWYFWPKPPPPDEPEPPDRPPPTGMQLVPRGEFTMGSSMADKFSRPEHKVTVGPYFMDITEVTNEEYKKFVDATAHKPPPDWKNGTFPDGKARFPVTGVTWNDANEYAKWAGKRLPTEAEWEFAARGTDGRLYPWGNKWDRKLANAAGASRGMREVGQGGQSPFGMYDMSGNAWEWTANDAVAYPGGASFTPDPPDQKIIRGGCWRTPNSREATSVNRAGWGATSESTYAETGIRCVKDIAK